MPILKDLKGFAYGIWRLDFQREIYGAKKQENSFFAPKLAHKWAQTIGARTE